MVLLACAPIGRLHADGVAAALALGLATGGWAETDSYALREAYTGAELAQALAEDRFEIRLRRARALVIAVEQLVRDGLAATAAFDLATRARQGGVPAFAVAARAEIDPFTARMLDLQVVLQARGPLGLQRAGERLAEAI